MEFLEQVTQSDNYWLIALVLIAVFILWFLPAMLALVFNRKQFKLILLACIPAGFSLIAWSGVLVWAVSGNAVNKYTAKLRADQK